MYNGVSTLAPSFLIGSSLCLQVTRTAIKAWMGSKFGKIGTGSAELAALSLNIFYFNLVRYKYKYIQVTERKRIRTKD